MNVEKGETPPPGILPQITVVGCLSMECALVVPMLSPRGRIIGTYFDSRPGGAAFRQAVACARLSRIAPEKSNRATHFTAVNVIGAVGDDYHGVQVVRALADELVEFSNLAVMRDTSTSMLFVIKEQTGRQATVAVPSANLRFTGQDDARDDSDFMNKLRREIPGPWPDVLVLQPELMDLGFIQHIIGLANEKRIPIVLEPTAPQKFPRDILSNINHLIMTELEAQRVLDYPNPVTNPSHEAMASARDLLREWGVKCVVITLRSRGTIFYSKRNLHEHVTSESLRREGFDWAGFRFAFTAAYAVAVARNKIFNIRAAVHDALEIADLAARGGTTELPGLGELQPSPFRFNHRKVKRTERAFKNDQRVVETARKYTKGAVGSGLERERAAGAGSQERPGGVGQGESRETSETMKEDESDEGYGVFGEGQGDVCKRKQGHALGEEMTPSKRFRTGYGDEKMEEEGSRKGRSTGKELDGHGGAAMADEGGSRDEVGEDGNGERDRDGTEDRDGAVGSDEPEGVEGNENDD